MNSFLSIDSVDDVQALVRRGLEMKEGPIGAWNGLGEGRTLGMIFMNPSLRTRLSTQKAGLNLGMNVMVMNAGGGDGWNLEMRPGAVMDGDAAEHIVDAARVISEYCDIVALRSFATLRSREEDRRDPVLSTFARESSVPVVTMESALGHPLQALADMMTIRERYPKGTPRVVLSWAPHPRALPQAVPNSFARWARAMEFDLVVANPQGYDLDDSVLGDVPVMRNQEEAFDGADVIYAKNWSASEPYGEVIERDRSWMIDSDDMARTNNAIFMHCLPVRRNVVVTDGVLDSPRSVVIPQAGNREFSAQVVLASLLEEMA